MKRYNLVIPKELYGEIEKVADKRRVKVVDVLRTYIEFGLWFEMTLAKPETTLVVKEGDKERELILFGSLTNTVSR
jgi:hypothetical protein